MSLKYILTFYYRKPSFFLLLFAITAGIISIIRNDFPTVFNIFSLTLPIIIIVNSKTTINLKVVNILFNLSLVGCIVTYNLGKNVYGYIPHLSLSTATGAVGWRISLFPSIPISAFFSLIILVLNYFYNHHKSRYFYLAVSSYFIFFSGLRSSILAFLCFVTFLGVQKVIRFKQKLFYKLFFLFAIGILIFIPIFSSILTHIGPIDNQFLNNLIYKADITPQSSEEISQSIMRKQIWKEHIRLFLMNPLFGTGTYDFSQYAPKELENKSGSESFLTSLLARIGFLIIFYLAFFASLIMEALRYHQKYLFFILITIFFIMLGYGSFFVPYNFIYLLIFGSIYFQRAAFTDNRTFNLGTIRN